MSATAHNAAHLRPRSIGTRLVPVLLCGLAFGAAVAGLSGLEAPLVPRDGLSGVLLAYASGITGAALLASPRSELRGSAPWLALASLLATWVALTARDVRLFALGFALAPLGLARALHLRAREQVRAPSAHKSARALRALVDRHALASGLPMVLCALLLPASHRRLDALATVDPTHGTLLCGLALIAALVRTGAPPFHAWIPAAASRAPLAVAVPALASPLGAYAFARIVVGLFPQTSEHWTPPLVLLGLLGAVYGSVVAFGRDDLQRLLGFVFVSQQGFVLAGLAARNAQGVSGGVAHALAAGCATVGMLSLARGLATRTGSADLRRVHGAGQRAPRMAAAFLLLALAAVGFPGTAGFVSEDLLVQGLLRAHPVLSALLLCVTALQGIVLYQAFSRAFLGPSSRDVSELDDLLPRENVAWLALSLALVFGGFAAGPLLAVERGVATALHAPAPTEPPHRAAH